MQARVKDLVSYMETLAPASIALSGDPVGLQLGCPEAALSKVLVAMDPDREAVEEAAGEGAEMLVTHHPLFYSKFSSINESRPGGALVAGAIRNSLNIFCAHTNYDIAPEGVSFQLARALALPVDRARVIEKTGNEQLLKLVVFIPEGHEGPVLEALTGAGAGQIGHYSHCSFQVHGTGTFKPGDNTNPFIGSRGNLEKVEETRLETILPATRCKAAIAKLIEAHPYEEVAYDLYPLNVEGRSIGLGLLITLEQPLSLEQLIQTCSKNLSAGNLRFWTGGKTMCSRIALCGGSGGSIIDQAADLSADVYISGDFSYHDLKKAQALGLAVIDAGHDATEMPGMLYLQTYLSRCLKADGYNTEVSLHSTVSPGWEYIHR